MPLYVYHCADCELDIEERRPFEKADAPLNCPICKSEVARKITVGFALSRSTSMASASNPPMYDSLVGKTHRSGCPCCR